MALALMLLAGVACRTAGPSRPISQGAEPPAPLPRLDAATHEQPVTGRLEAGGTRDYLLQVPAHHYVRIEIEQRGVDLKATVIDPEGHEIAWAEGPGGNWVAESTSWISRTGGENRIHIEPAVGETNGGEFRIEVAEMRPAVPTDRERLAADAALAEARGLASSLEPGDDERAITSVSCARTAFVGLGDHHRVAETQDLAVLLAPRSEEVRASELAVALWEATDDLEGLLMARITYEDFAYRARERGSQFARETAAEKALSELSRIERLSLAISSERALSYSLDRQGFLFFRLEQTAQALQPLQRAAELRRSMRDIEGEYFSLLSLGAIQRALGRPYEALASYDRASELVEQYHYSNLEQHASLLLNQGYLQSRLGDLDSAQEKFREAVRISRQSKDVGTEYRLHLHLGSLYSQLGDSSQARSEYMAAIALARGDDDGVTYDGAYALFLLAWHLTSEGQADEALSLFKQALTYFTNRPAQHPAFQRLLGNLQLGLGSAYLELGDLTTSQESLLAAKEAYDQADSVTGQIETLLRLGQVRRRQGQLKKARELLDEALKGAENIEDQAREGAIRSELARLEHQRGRDLIALSELERAIDLREALRANLSVPSQRATFFADWRHDYDLLVDILMRQSSTAGPGWTHRAFEASERSHARTLLELLANAGLDLRAGVPEELKRRETQAERRLSFLQNQLTETKSAAGTDSDTVEILRAGLASTRREREEIERQIWQNAPRYAEVRNPRVPSIEAIQASIPPETALLEYSLGDERSFLFVITRSTFATFSLPAADLIRTEVRQVQVAMDAPAQDPRHQRVLEETLADLYRVLVQPAKKQIEDLKRLLIVPDRELFYLPFEALRPASRLNGRDSRYLLQDWAVGYIPSASVLLQLDEKEPPQDFRLEFLAFGDPHESERSGEQASLQAREDNMRSRSSSTLGSLPGARQEVEDLSHLFEPSKTEVLVGPAATETALKLSNPVAARFLHFAAHGVIDTENPSYSHIVLAPDPQSGEDGLLHMFEIFDLHLSTDLVVLSACETALGKEVRGEGLVGLTRSFLYAGAPRIVVSLWPVSDDSTPELMRQLYSHLLAGFDTLEALRQAKLDLLKGQTYRHPRYWAPFILVGSP